MGAKVYKRIAAPNKSIAAPIWLIFAMQNIFKSEKKYRARQHNPSWSSALKRRVRFRVRDGAI
jgi:hypothetical protein